MLVQNGDSIHSQLVTKTFYVDNEAVEEISYYETESYDSEDSEEDAMTNLMYDENLIANASIVEVPMWVAILIIVVYITGATYAFKYSEAWMLYESFYFVCVTLATIVSCCFY
jgi:hypothetical protein